MDFNRTRGNGNGSGMPIPHSTSLPTEISTHSQNRPHTTDATVKSDRKNAESSSSVQVTPIHAQPVRNDKKLVGSLNTVSMPRTGTFRAPPTMTSANPIKQFQRAFQEPNPRTVLRNL